MASKFITVTPTWEQIVPALVQILNAGNAESRKFALEELTRMARLADKQVALIEAGEV